MEDGIQQTHKRVSDLEEASRFGQQYSLKMVTRIDLQIKIPLSIGVIDGARTDRITSQGAKPQGSIEWL
jgi:hypothetical protein